MKGSGLSMCASGSSGSAACRKRCPPRQVQPAARAAHCTGWAPVRAAAYHAPMSEAFICDAVRTPIGRYGGSLAAVRPDDLAAVPIAALLARNPNLDPKAVDEV